MLNPIQIFKKPLIFYPTLILTNLFLNLWIYKIPLSYLMKYQIPLSGDGLLTGTYLKSVLGASYADILSGQVQLSSTSIANVNFANYPVGNLLEILLIKVVATLLNLSIISQLIPMIIVLKSLLVSITSCAVSRKMGFNHIESFTIGILFNFSYFNLVRSEGHFFLGMTWNIPFGILMIYLLALYYQNYRLEKKITVIAIGVVIGLSTLFYSFVTVIILMTLIITIGCWSIIKHFGAISTHSSHELYKVLKLNFLIPVAYFILPSIIGLLIQLIPILRNSSKSFPFSESRSFVEPFIYGGNLESLFSGFNNFFLNILKRPDVQNYIASRVPWEGSQAGGLTGLTTIILVTFLIIVLFSKSLDLSDSNDPNLKVIAGIFVVFMIYYLVTPLNVLMSRIIYPIRAWGRLSVYLAFLSLLLCGIFLKKILRNNKVIAVFILPIFLMFPASEIYAFHKSRPQAEVLTSAAKLLEKNSKEVVNVLNKYQCDLYFLPIYPFPEFDNPLDVVSDYEMLRLPLESGDEIKWSNLAFKNTDKWRIFEPLASQQPDFSRVTIRDSIALNAQFENSCKILIDKKMLVKTELEQLQNLTFEYPQCVSSNFKLKENRERYIIWDNSVKKCKIQVPDITAYYNDVRNSRVLWRVDNINQVFDHSWAMVSTKEQLRVRFLNFSKKVFVAKVWIKDLTNLDKKIEICIGIKNSYQCERHIPDKNGHIFVKINTELDSGTLGITVSGEGSHLNNSFYGVRLLN